MEKIVRLCTRATEIDPGYAQAWALMAIGQMVLHFTHRREGDGGLKAGLDFIFWETQWLDTGVGNTLRINFYTQLDF